MTTTATAYTRRTIGGGRKTVQYYTNGRVINLSKGRVGFIGKNVAGAIQPYSLRVASRVIGHSHKGVTNRVMTVRHVTGSQKIRVYTVGRNTSARNARRNREHYLASKNMNVNRTHRLLNTGSGISTGKNTVRMRRNARKAGISRRSRPPQLTRAQRQQIARRRRRGAHGRFA